MNHHLITKFMSNKNPKMINEDLICLYLMAFEGISLCCY